MKTTRSRISNRVLTCAWLAIMSLGSGVAASAQVSPNEILDPRLKSLEKQYLPQLKTMNQEVFKIHFPFPFYLSRVVGLDPSQQVEADTRGLEFRRFRDRITLKATGNYNAAYDSKQFTRNERATRTFRDVFLPILQVITRNIPPDVDCDAIGIEVGFHVHDVGKSYDYEGRDILVVVLDRDPTLVDTHAREKSAKNDATSTAGSSSSASRLIRSNPNLLPSAGNTADSAISSAPQVDLSQSKPAVTPADADKLQGQYQPQLDALSKEGRAKFGFVDYDPPTFVVVGKQMVLQMTLKNTARFDPEKSSIYKRAAQTFDLFVAPKMKDVLDLIPSDLPVDYYDFSVVNTLNSASGGKERSEAIEFLLPRNLARRFANSDITNQELLDKGQVLVNGVRIALNLQLVE